MKIKNKREIIVYADWETLKGPIIMGYLTVIIVRDKEIFSFEYNHEWLHSGNSFELDPDLGLYSGSQFAREVKSNFGIFLDSSPDRWGRVLMKRREAVMARIDQRPEKRLQESDFLLGVYDEYRMGALRFKEDVNGNFLNDNKAFAAPPWTSLRELENASMQLEQEEFTTDQETLKWLNMLIAPGSSLGGARPKASVQDNRGDLWIAKFPSKYDEYNIGAWEMVTYEITRLSGIRMADSMAQLFSGRYHTFLSKRFDRTSDKKRIHFASAMTLLGYTDGADYHDGVSYLELAEFILRNGANVQKDLEELWTRIVFSVCIRNTDDHLRNHGFILTTTGWTLSPAFDLNPNPTGAGLKLNISETDNSLDLDLVIEVLPYFRISEKRALEIISSVKYHVAKWESMATKMGISRSEQDRMKDAFFTD